jgi:hypothetical protein
MFIYFAAVKRRRNDAAMENYCWLEKKMAALTLV